MFTEINNLEDAEKLLHSEYKKNYKECKKRKDKKYIKLKLKHSYDCLKILKESFSDVYDKYAIAILLHDLGRFYEYKKIDDFRHEDYGYEYLKENYTKNPLILLPVKYHEKDLNFMKSLIKEKEFENCSKSLQEDIIECSNILRDIDVISNMKSISRVTRESKRTKINKDLIEKLKDGKLATKEDIKSEYDEIVYILCGLVMISSKNSWEYLRKHKIIKRLLRLLYKMSNTSKEKNMITKEIEKLILDKYEI